MKVFRELQFDGPADECRPLFENLLEVLGDEWKRNNEEEDRLRRDLGPLATERYCFSCSSAENLEAGNLWIAPGDHDKFEVINFVPTEKRELSIDEYNKTILEFYDRIQEFFQDTGISLRISSDIVSIDDFASEEVVKKLKMFSRIANKSTGTAHPSDGKRWRDFLVLMFRNGERIPTDKLELWLIEDEGWPVDKAIKILIQYEQGIDLLEHYTNYDDNQT